MRLNYAEQGNIKKFKCAFIKAGLYNTTKMISSFKHAFSFSAIYSLCHMMQCKNLRCTKNLNYDINHKFRIGLIAVLKNL